jgi:hypothetical protein
MAVFWVVAPCSLVEVNRRSRGACCLHHQGDSPRRQLSSYSPPWEPEILRRISTTRRYNPEDCHLDTSASMLWRRDKHTRKLYLPFSKQNQEDCLRASHGTKETSDHTTKRWAPKHPAAEIASARARAQTHTHIHKRARNADINHTTSITRNGEVGEGIIVSSQEYQEEETRNTIPERWMHKAVMHMQY